MEKLSISQLTKYEEENNVWNIKIFNYPVWIHIRPLLIENEKPVPYNYKISLISIFKSFFQTIWFLLYQTRFENVYFIRDRAEMVQFFLNDMSSKKIVFLNPEVEKYYDGKSLSPDFLNIIRFISRKTSNFIFKKEIYQLKAKISNFLQIDAEINKAINIAVGDAIFLKLLSKILTNKNKKYYSGCVIPLGEKFNNFLNSYEIQHGVIYNSHPQYASLPNVKNNIIVYAEKYKEILIQSGFTGNIIVNEYKKKFFEEKSDRCFEIVIYTQPLIKLQKAIAEYIKNNPNERIFIQKHPSDYFDYRISQSYFVKNTIPSEVKYPILYTTSIIENFVQSDRDCYIFDIKDEDIILDQFLEAYSIAYRGNFIIKNNLQDLIVYIREKICNES